MCTLPTFNGNLMRSSKSTFFVNCILNHSQNYSTDGQINLLLVQQQCVWRKISAVFRNFRLDTKIVCGCGENYPFWWKNCTFCDKFCLQRKLTNIRNALGFQCNKVIIAMLVFQLCLHQIVSRCNNLQSLYT